MFTRRAPLLVLLGSSLFGFGAACGGMNDATTGSTTKVATISGALTGTAAPAGAHVALVWRAGTTSRFTVGGDAPVVDGRFSLVLEAPPDDYFVEAAGSSSASSGSGDSAPGSSTSSSGGPAPGSSTSGGTGSLSIVPKDTASGRIASPFAVAVGGFVVWSDANGNGVLDLLGATADTPDRVLGGNSELFIADLRGGGALDYEKLRDRAGVAPTEGFNLVWTEGRWLPLNEVELKLSSLPRLAGPVCGGTSGYSSGGASSGSGEVPAPKGSDGSSTGGSSSGGSSAGGSSSSGGSSGASGGGSAGGANSYPSPTDPNLHCAADGRSFSYSFPTTCSGGTGTPTPASGLCAGAVIDVPVCSGGGYGAALPADAIPEGWPCTVVVPADAGAPVSDASIDGGSIDASSK